MNRLIWNMSEQAAPAGALWPAQDPKRTGTPGVDRPARVLFIGTKEFGFVTTTRNLERYAEARADIEAVHVHPDRPTWQRIFSRHVRLPKGLDLHWARLAIAWRWRLRSLLADSGPIPATRFDVVHILTQQRAGVIADFVSPRFGARPDRPRFVVNADATIPNWRRMQGWTPVMPEPETGMESRVLKLADAVACASRWVMDSVTTDLGVEPSRAFVHMPCVSRPAGVGVPVRTIDASRPVRLLFVANDWVGKNGPMLLRWHQQRWADRAELHVVSKTAPRDPSARNVVWHGAVPHDRLVGEIFPSADVLVMPTPLDTFLIVAQEAQLFGVPVVTTRLSGIQEVVRDNVSGILCDRGQESQYIAAVERLLNDTALRQRLSAGALDHADRNLNADRWHNHLLDQLVRVAQGQPVRTCPAGVDLPPAGAASSSPRTQEISA